MSERGASPAVPRPGCDRRPGSRNGEPAQPRAIVADEGYDSVAGRALARKRGSLTVMPCRKTTRNRPKRFAKTLYRALARIEQAALNFTSFIALAAAFNLLMSVHRT